MAERRPMGSGTLDQLPSGRWRVRARRADGTRVTRTFVRKDDAEGCLRGLQQIASWAGA